MTTSNPMGTALITGASRGIGAVYADRLAKRGYDLILVARDASRLEQLADKLKRETGRAVTPLRADLSNSADRAKVEDALKHNPSISLLLNNAGAASVQHLLNADVEKMDEIIALNISALTRLTYAAAPAFVARGRGTIINIASIVGVSPETLNGVYGASKAFVIAFSHSLRHELTEKGVRIQTVLPPATATDLSGNLPDFPIRSCRPQSSCRQMIWLMRHSLDSTWVNRRPSQGCRMGMTGCDSRRRDEVCLDDWAIHIPRRDIESRRARRPKMGDDFNRQSSRFGLLIVASAPRAAWEQRQLGDSRVQPRRVNVTLAPNNANDSCPKPDLGQRSHPLPVMGSYFEARFPLRGSVKSRDARAIWTRFALTTLSAPAFEPMARATMIAPTN